MKNKIKKTVLKARYVDLELQEVKDIFAKCHSEWNSYVSRVSAENNISNTVKQCNMKEEQKKDKRKVKPKKKLPGVVKHMYRDIAKEVHPDKNRDADEDTERLMRQATRAKDSGDLISLMNMCEDLGLKTPNLREGHLKFIENDIKTKAREIHTMRSSDAWIWFHADEANKLKIEEMLIKALTQ